MSFQSFIFRCKIDIPLSSFSFRAIFSNFPFSFLLHENNFCRQLRKEFSMESERYHVDKWLWNCLHHADTGISGWQISQSSITMSFSRAFIPHKNHRNIKINQATPKLGICKSFDSNKSNRLIWKIKSFAVWLIYDLNTLCYSWHKFTDTHFMKSLFIPIQTCIIATRNTAHNSWYSEQHSSHWNTIDMLKLCFFENNLMHIKLVRI